MKKCVLIYSGGMDSFTLLNELLKEWDLYALSFDYGQRHKKELHYAREYTTELDIPHKIVDLSNLNEFMQGSALTSNIKVPEGHYEEESMKATVVPNRNMIMLSIASAWAISLDAEAVYIGAHAGDHAIYPDCRPEFIAAVSRTVILGNYKQVNILAPYLHLTKGDIARIGKHLNLDYTRAWTCYNGREKACGKCGACQERIEAMEFAGIKDYTEYES